MLAIAVISLILHNTSLKKCFDNRIKNQKLIEMIQTLQTGNEKLAERIYNVETDNQNLLISYEKLADQLSLL